MSPSFACVAASSRLPNALTSSNAYRLGKHQNDVADQAAINAAFDFRRYATKPTPAKPSSSIAHVEGSGTAPTCVVDRLPP